MARHLALLAAGLVVPLALHLAPPPWSGAGVPTVRVNDNRHPAGRLRGDTLFLDLELRTARWYPEADDGDFVEDAFLAEAGKAPQVPAPLIRVRQGTHLVVRLTNRLADSTARFYGLASRPGMDTLQLAPGATVTRRFVAGAAGTYVYGAHAGVVDHVEREREQAFGAFVVDAPGARTDDRVFVMNAWGEPLDSVRYRNALTINGKGWPHTERIATARGDTLRWRVVNGTIRVHPMHLHGFYFRILALGDGAADSTFPPALQPLAVTERMRGRSTMRMEWVPEREGNWLFHCHLSFHVVPTARYSLHDTHAEHRSSDVEKHMAGLVLGIAVGPGREPEPAEDRAGAQAMRLLVQEGARHGRAPRAMGFVLQQGTEPTADSVEIPGTPLVLTRGRPTDITVVNRLAEATAVHWHGIELESWSDGVAGWSGAHARLAPPIAPGDSFTARLTLKRPGTFIYHTHLNDVEQLTSGLYGAIVVLEPGERWDARTDHLFVVGWDGPAQPAHLVVNGDSAPPPLVLEAGVEHRFRFVFIQPVGGNAFRLLADSAPARWRTVARDGADLPDAQRETVPAETRGWAGQTYDFAFTPEAREYRLVAGDPARPAWQRRVIGRRP